MDDLAETERVEVCDLCGGTSFRPVFSSRGWRLVRCADCDLVMTSPRRTPAAMEAFYRQTYYEQATDYASGQLQPPTPDDRRLVGAMTALVRQSGLATPASSLDVGCGHGRLVNAFAQAGWRAVGLDPSVSACAAGRREGLDLRVGALEDATFDESFSVITAYHVLEHAYEPRAFLQRCRELLAPGGLLVVEVPNFACPASRRAGADWERLYPDIHLFQFTRATLERFLRSVEFDPLRWRLVGGRGPLSIDAQRQGTAASVRSRSAMFSMRRAIYWAPGAQRLARWLLWEALGYGEAIRVIARREP